jgi:hypothetical protein
MKDNTITVYWSPYPFTKENSQWNMLYREPEPVLSGLKLDRRKTNKGLSNFWICPTFIESMSNVYQVKNNMNLDYSLPMDEINEKQNIKGEENFNINVGKVSLHSPRVSSLNNYVNINLNMSWLMFAEESVNVKVSAPYFPTVSVGDGVLVAAGEFDIGTWYRPFNYDMHIPLTTTELKFKKDDPLLFFEFMTDKKIVFKRYIMTDYLNELSKECIDFWKRFDSNIKLVHKYKMFKQSKMREIILKEIKNNLID